MERVGRARGSSHRNRRGIGDATTSEHSTARDAISAPFFCFTGATQSEIFRQLTARGAGCHHCRIVKRSSYVRLTSSTGELASRSIISAAISRSSKRSRSPSAGRQDETPICAVARPSKTRIVRSCMRARRHSCTRAAPCDGSGDRIPSEPGFLPHPGPDAESTALAHVLPHAPGSLNVPPATPRPVRENERPSR